MGKLLLLKKQTTLICYYLHWRNISFSRGIMTDFVEFKVKLHEHRKTSHSLFLRQHRVREKVEGKPTDRTLFIGNVPPFFNEHTLETLFSPFGKVDAVYIHKTPSPKVPEKELSQFFKKHGQVEGFKVAYVVFDSPKSMNHALENTKEVVVPRGSICTGYKKWAQEYNERIPDATLMQKEIEQFMVEFDQNDAKKRKLEKEASEMDDEGWTTVTKKSKKPGFSRKESVIKHLNKKSEQRRKKKELTNFYRFQIKESKMKNLVTLRQKFEEDKKRIAAIKATRRFKPF